MIDACFGVLSGIRDLLEPVTTEIEEVAEEYMRNFAELADYTGDSVPMVLTFLPGPKKYTDWPNLVPACLPVNLSECFCFTFTRNDKVKNADGSWRRSEPRRADRRDGQVHDHVGPHRCARGQRRLPSHRVRRNSRRRPF